MPAIPIPGHPSFPSGHATQSMLMALCLGEALAAYDDVPGRPGTWAPLLQALSCRIARNREIAGLHFKSDTVAGFELARNTLDKLMEGHAFTALLQDATSEWAR